MAANREGSGGLGTVTPSKLPGLLRPGSRFLYPSQTLGYVASVLRINNYRVSVIDAVLEGYDLSKTLFRMNQRCFRVVGIFVAHQTLQGDIYFIQQVRKYFPHAILIALGASTRFCYEEILEKAPLDLVILGEPEILFTKVCRALETQDGAFSRTPLRYLEGIVTRQDYQRARQGAQTGTPTKNLDFSVDSLGFVQDLDHLPFPAWDLFPYRKFPFFTVTGSRGCEQGCSYCPYTVAQGTRFRSRSPESIVREIAWLKTEFQMKKLVFRDPVFAFDRDRVLQICRLILKNKLDVPWECESRPDHFDEELLRAMKEAGCREIKVGLESTNIPLLLSLNRVKTREEAISYLRRFEELVETTRKLGLRARAFIMVGLPGQTPGAILETSRYLKRLCSKELSPWALHVKIFTQHPGLPLTQDGNEPQTRPYDLKLLRLQLEKELVPPIKKRQRYGTLKMWALGAFKNLSIFLYRLPAIGDRLSTLDDQ